MTYPTRRWPKTVPKPTYCAWSKNPRRVQFVHVIMRDEECLI